MGRAMLSKSLVQFSVVGQGCVLGAPSPAAGHCRARPLLKTPGHSWASLGQSLGGHCSFLLGPGAHKVLFMPFKSLFLQSCVSSGGSMVGLMVTSSMRAYAIPRSTAPRAPAPQQSTAGLYLNKRHSNTVLSQSLWGLLSPGMDRVCLSKVL